MQWSPDLAASEGASWTSLGLDADTLQNIAFDPMQTVPKPLSPAMLSLLEDIIVQQMVPFSPHSFEPSISEARPLPDLASMSSSSNSTFIPAVPPVQGYINRHIFMPRTEYAARRIAAQASSFASQGWTPFIHHTQIVSSPILRDAISASALHAMRNYSNAPIVKTEIARRANLLVDTIEAARAQYPPLEIDMLHPVQALIIYQCIRLFSTSDIAQQAQAERDGTHLRAWLNKLREQLRPSTPSPDGQTPTQNQNQSWEAWIGYESVRRTVVFAELLNGVYTFLKYGWDDADTRMRTLEFSAHAGLWEARSAVEWRAIWATSPPIHVNLANFNADIERAKPCDLDDLSVAIRAVNSGLESLEEWLVEDAVAVQKWGLRAESNRQPAY